MPHKSRNLFALMALALMLAHAAPATAQEPSREMITSLKRAVVIVTTYDDRGTGLLQGSGFFITPAQIVTNLHVVKGASLIRIKTFAGTTITVQSVVATDPNSDLALLQISTPCPDATTLQVEYATPVEGEPIIVLSNPQGSHWKLTRGLVGPIWDFADVGPRMQITASVLPGSSGGPVLNQQGHVIGIAAMHTGSADDLNFAVPAERLKALQTSANRSTIRISVAGN